MAITLVLVAACTSCRNDTPALSKSATRPGPNLTETSPAKAKPVADNPMSGCDMCHVDVIDEFADSKHKNEGVTCTTCHGFSVAHAADENNEVKPDRTFTKKNVDAFCGDCHPCTRPNAAALATQPNANQKVCIDCHDAH